MEKRNEGGASEERGREEGKRSAPSEDGETGEGLVEAAV
jgi:hypothetical protein